VLQIDVSGAEDFGNDIRPRGLVVRHQSLPQTLDQIHDHLLMPAVL
jgi:hypothetical protein